MKTFREIHPESVSRSPIDMIGRDWMLITSGSMDSYNTMTASWGGMGFLWNRPVVFCFVRPERYTYGFMEKNELFTLSFFEEKYREALNFCGAKSGRDHNKAAEAGLSPRVTADGTVFFDESVLYYECRKIYFHDLDRSRFLDPSIEKNYQNTGLHRMYVGEIVHCLAGK